MKKYCIECGKEAQADHKICIHCGANLPETEQETEQETEHKSQPTDNQNNQQKEVKVFASKKAWAIAGLVLVLLLAHMGLKPYYSLGNVEKRFLSALEEESKGKLKKLISHEDGQEVKDVELDAFLKLMSSQQVDQPVYNLELDGEKFFFYPNYKVYYRDQYAHYNNKYEDLQCTFNGEDFLIDEAGEDLSSYGPFLPGIYQAELDYDGDMGAMSQELDVFIFNEYDNSIYLDDIFEISTVYFGVNNYNNSLEDKLHIQLNDRKIKLDENGESDEVGPVFLSAGPSFKIVSDLPWGKISSEAIKIDDYQAYGEASLVNDEQYEELTGKVLNFAEEYLQALAKKSTDSLTDVSSSVKKLVTDYIETDYNYMGRLEKVEFDRSSVTLYQDEESEQLILKVPSVFHISESIYSDNLPVLDESNFAMNMEFLYKDDSKWLIENFGRESYPSMEATKTLKGSKELYASKKGAEESVTTKQLQDSVSTFIDQYETAYVDSINYRDFDLLKDFLDPNGPRYKEAKDYLVYLEEKGITEGYYGINVKDIETIDDKSWKVSYRVGYDIIKGDETNYKDFDTTILLIEKDSSYYVKELLDNKEIKN